MEVVSQNYNCFSREPYFDVCPLFAAMWDSYVAAIFDDLVKKVLAHIESHKVSFRKLRRER